MSTEQDTLKRLVEDFSASALEQLPKSARGLKAFHRWLLATTAEDDVESRALFAAESAFAAIARIAVSNRLDYVPVQLVGALPHLFSSDLFSWFQPRSSSRKS